ncbi:hypothetical protein PTI98_002566 [Pleurotus ostreatus]|nr:hypothetical protein PTI98_002566 [Pleurotus ostreatus]
MPTTPVLLLFVNVFRNAYYAQKLWTAQKYAAQARIWHRAFPPGPGWEEEQISLGELRPSNLEQFNLI